MKRLINFYIILFLFVFIGFPLNAKVLYDQKALTVGVLSNRAFPQFTQNPNIRFLGEYPEADLLNNGGQITLDKLFNLNHPSIEGLYHQALKEYTQEEYEIAIKDISADPQTILKMEGAVQLIKNNYIVIFNTVTDWRKEYQIFNYDDSEKIKWTVYHVEIDDEIVNQVFYNWEYPSKLRQIQVPLKKIASGKIKKSKMSEIIYKISKKVGSFAIRGPILSEHPTTAYITSTQGVEPGFIVKIYQTYENSKGEMSSKRISQGVVLKTNEQESELKIIAGRTPSDKKGDIAWATNYIFQSITIEGEYSFGKDWRAGGRLLYDIGGYIGKFSLYGTLGLEVHQFNKDPINIWYEENTLSSKSYQPSLRTGSILAGFGLGYSLSNKFEFSPYYLIGIGGGKLTKDGYFYLGIPGLFKKVDELFLGLPMYVGLKMAVNINYPLQLIIGCNYNYFYISKENSNPATRGHNFNRMNVSLGFKYNF